MKMNVLVITSLVAIISIFISCNDDNYSRSTLRHRLNKEFSAKTSDDTWKKKNLHQPNPQGHRADVIYLSDGRLVCDSLIKVVFPMMPVPGANLSKYVNAYADSMGLKFPQYFIMRSDMLINFLKGTTGYSSTQYLQTYLCTNDTTGYLDLAVCGTYTNVPGGQYLATDTFILQGSVFGDFYNPYTCATVQDNIMEGYIQGKQNIYHYSSYPGPAMSTLQLTNTSLISSQLASARIDTYEKHEELPLALSCIIDTDSIGLFLNNYQFQYNYKTGMSQPGYIVPYVQIYMAYDSCNQDHTTIIIVGLDRDGNHIYLTPDKGKSIEAFNTAYPCPYCNVNPNILDVPSE